jgi:hypothetical protein
VAENAIRLSIAERHDHRFTLLRTTPHEPLREGSRHAIGFCRHLIPHNLICAISYHDNENIAVSDGVRASGNRAVGNITSFQPSPPRTKL